MAQLGLTQRCTLLEGDNREVCPQGSADRVILGLLPDSEVSWRTACLALRDRGGVLHVHGNVESARGQQRRERLTAHAETVREAMCRILTEVKNKDFTVHVSHVECVKSYAPRIYHVVVDLKCENNQKPIKMS